MLGWFLKSLIYTGSAGHVSTSMCSRWCSVLWSSGDFVTATPPAASPTASPAGYIRCVKQYSILSSVLIIVWKDSFLKWIYTLLHLNCRFYKFDFSIYTPTNPPVPYLTLTGATSSATGKGRVPKGGGSRGEKQEHWEGDANHRLGQAVQTAAGCRSPRLTSSRPSSWWWSEMVVWASRPSPFSSSSGCLSLTMTQPLKTRTSSTLRWMRSGVSLMVRRFSWCISFALVHLWGGNAIYISQLSLKLAL